MRHLESCSVHRGKRCDCVPADFLELKTLWDAAWNEVQDKPGRAVNQELRDLVYRIGAEYGWLPDD